MPEPATDPKPKKKDELQYPYLLIPSGMITKIQLTEADDGGRTYLHGLNLPSDDSYGDPPRIGIKCKSRLGAEGEVINNIKVKCVRYARKHDGKTYYNHDFWAE